MYTQSNCITRRMTNRSDTACTHTEQSLAHLAAHVADMLQQGLQGLQGTVAVVVTQGSAARLPGAAETPGRGYREGEFGQNWYKSCCMCRGRETHVVVRLAVCSTEAHRTLH